MPTNEEGEFELVLGNKQLLSVFFLVVLLLAVFFSMGYLAGRYSAPTTVAGGTGKPQVIDAPQGTQVAGVTPPPVDVSKPSPSQPPVDTRPEPPPSQTATPPRPEPPRPEPPKPAPPKPEPPKPKPEPPKPEPPRPAPVGALPAGSYFQVVATKKNEADIVSDALGKKGFPVRLMQVPNSELFRVLVGPLGDGAAAAKTKEGLEAAGFKPIPRKI